MEHERGREGRITDEQKRMMIEYMEEHLIFASEKFTGNEGRKKLYSLWEVLAKKLNSLDGPKKSTAKWRRVWINLRNRTKRKASEATALRLKTGESPPSNITLTEVDDRILSIKSEVVDSDEVLPHFLSFSRPAPSMNSTHPEASTSYANPIETIRIKNLVPSPSPSATDPLEFSGSDGSLIRSENEVEANDGGFHRTNKRKRRSTSMDAFPENMENLNNKMDILIDIMHVLAEEKKKQTALMEELLELKKKKYRNV